jgi:hypothetical protein
MSASDHLQRQQFMYHSSPKINRNSIAQTGLRTDFADEDEGEDHFRGVYVTPTEPAKTDHEDIWRVNTSGMKLAQDTIEDFHEFGGSYISRRDIPPSRLFLHHEAP